MKQMSNLQLATLIDGIGGDAFARYDRHRGKAGPGQKPGAPLGSLHVAGTDAPGHLDHQVNLGTIGVQPALHHDISQHDVIGLLL